MAELNPGLEEISKSLLQTPERVEPIETKETLSPDLDLISKSLLQTPPVAPEEKPIALPPTQRGTHVEFTEQEGKDVEEALRTSSANVEAETKRLVDEYVAAKSKAKTPEELAKVESDFSEKQKEQYYNMLQMTGGEDLLTKALGAAGTAYDVIKSAFVKEKEAPKVKPKTIKELYDPTTRRIAMEDIPQLLQTPMKPQLKNKIENWVLSAQYGMDPEDVAKGRLYGVGANNKALDMLARVDSAISGELGGKIATVVRNKGEEMPPVPPDFLTPEQLNYIRANAGNSDASLQFPQFEISLPGNLKDEKEIVKKLWENYVGAVRDIKFDAGRSALMSNAGLVTSLGAGKLAGPLLNKLFYINSPLTALIDKYGVKVAPKVLNNAFARITAAAVEGAAPALVKEGQIQSSELIAGALLGGVVQSIPEAIIHIAGRKVPVQTPEQLKQIQVEKEAVNAIKNNIDLDTVSPEVRKEVNSVKAIKSLSKEDGTFDARSITEALENGVVNEEIKPKILKAATELTGLSPEQLVDRQALKTTSREIKDKDVKARFDSVLTSPEFLVAAGDEEKVINLLVNKQLESTVNVYRENRGLYNNENKLLRSSLIEIMRTAVESAGQEKVSFIGMGNNTSKYIANMFKMMESTGDITPVLTKLDAVQNKINVTDKKIFNSMSEIYKQTQDIRIYDILDKYAAAEKAGTGLDIKTIRKEINDIAESTGVDKKFGPSVTKQLKSALTEYDNLQNRAAELHQDVYNHMANTTFSDNIKDASKSKTSDADQILMRANTTDDNLEIGKRFIEHVAPALDNKKVGEDFSKTTIQFIRDSSINISAGERVPQKYIDGYKMELEQLKGMRDVKRLRDMVVAVENYNKERHFIEAISEMGQDITEHNPEALSSMIPLFREANKNVYSPRNVEALGNQQALLSVTWANVMENSGLAKETQVELFNKLFGGERVQFQMAVNPTTPIETPTHSMNVINAMQSYTEDILNDLDGIHLEAFGKKLDRETFLAHFINPANMMNASKTAEKLMINVAVLKGRREQVRKQLASGEFSNLLINMETLDHKLVAETNLACGAAFETRSAEIREASGIFSNTFQTELDQAKVLMKDFGQKEGASYVMNKLQGMAGVGELYFKTKLDGTTEVTNPGKIFQAVFFNDENINAFREIAKTGDAERGRAYLLQIAQKALNGDQLEEVLQKNTLLHVFNYLKLDQFNMKHMDAHFYKSAWGGIEFVNNFRAKGFNVTKELLDRKNIEKRSTGYKFKGKEWREDYVYTKMNSNARLTDIVDTVFVGDDLSKYFGSSTDGQIRKAGEFIDERATDLIHPIISAIQDVHTGIRETNSQHSRAILQQHAVELLDMGALIQASAVTQHLAHNIIEKSSKKLRDAIFSFSNNKYYRIIGAPLNLVGSLVGRYVPTLALSAPSAWLRALFGQALMNKTWSSNTKDLRFLKNTIKAIANKDIIPSNMTPVMGNIVNRMAGRYKDQVNRSGFKLLDQLALRSKQESSTLLPDKVKSLIAKTDIAALEAERMLVKGSEFISEHLKERIESSMSKSVLTQGGEVYEEVLNMFSQGKSRQEVFELLGSAMKSKSDTQLWQLVTRIKQSFDAKDGYALAEDFLHMYHQNNVGSFGPIAAPALLPAFSTFAPAAARYFVAKTNSLYRTGMTISALNKSAQYMMSKHGVPPQQSKRLMSAFLMGAAATGGLQVLRGGLNSLPFVDTLVDNEDETQWGVMRRIVMKGAGVDLTSLSPNSTLDTALELTKSVASGNTENALGVLLESILDLKKQRGTPFIATEIMSSWEGLKELNNVLSDRVPVLNLFESKIEKAEKEYRKLEAEYREKLSVMGGTPNADIVRMRDALAKKEEDINGMRSYYHDNLLTNSVDLLLQRSPVSSWIAFGNNPLSIAMNVVNARNAELVQTAADEERAKLTQPYLGPLSLISQFLGIQPPLSTNIDAARQFYTAYYADSNLSPEKKKIYADMAAQIDMMLTNSDKTLNYYIQRGDIGGKKSWEQFRKALVPHVKAPPTEMRQRELSDTEARINKLFNKPPM